MVDFICKGCIELSRTRVERESQNKKFLSTMGFEPGAFRLRSEGATNTGVSRVDKSLPGFNCDIFRNLPVAWCPKPSEVQFVVYFCHIIFVSFLYLTN